MAKTLAQLEREIATLQRDAETLRKKEAVGVIERMKVAIQHYGLTAEDLFGPKTGRNGLNTVKKAARGKRGQKNAAGVIRFRDDAGHTWTGHGRRPRWFVEAMESGKTAEALSVKG